MNKEKAFDLVVLAFIVLAGLGIAYVTFGILESSAQAEIQKYSVGGAIAGALISMSLLASVYQQFRRGSTELDELRKRVQELQQKLIRGAPCPNGFETEVSERQHIVLAYPKAWARQGGTIFQSEEPIADGDDDVFPARFNCWFAPITKDTDKKSEYYAKYKSSVAAAPFVQPPYTTEMMMVGGEAAGVSSLRVMAHEYVRIWVERNPLTNRVTTNFHWISKDEFTAPTPEAGTQRAAPAPAAAGAVATPDGPTQAVYNKMVIRMTVVCYHEQLESIFFFECIDDVDDFTESSSRFNQILDSVRFLT